MIRVKETSTTQGTGDITLAGASTGFVTFNSGIGTSIQLIMLSLNKALIILK